MISNNLLFSEGVMKFKYDISIEVSLSKEHWALIFNLCRNHPDIERHTLRGGFIYGLNNRLALSLPIYLDETNIDIIQKALEYEEGQELQSILTEHRKELQREQNRLLDGNK